MGRGRGSTAELTARSPLSIALLIVVASLVGLVAATALTIDKLALLAHPGSALSCNFSVLIGCSKGLVSWQGSLLGFPNSILGMAAWAALLAIGLVMLTRSALSRMAWLGINVGLAGAFVLVVFLIGQSIYVLGVLCPWCMATWVITIPAFLGVTFFNVGRWSGNRRAGRLAGACLRWLPLITLGCYLVVAVLAQLRLDLLHSG